MTASPQPAETEPKQHLLRALWRAKMHVDKEALALSPARVWARYEHIWAPAEELMSQLVALPLGLLQLWQSSERGHLLFGHASSAYLPGPQAWRDTTLDGVCRLCLAELADQADAPWWTLWNLFDHLLGSDGRANEPWLSDGAGTCAALAEVGARFQRIHQLGYGHQELGVMSAHDYFARTARLYQRDPLRLNVLDPQAERLWRATLLDEAWWARLSRTD
jgi:hypothetical protein